MDFTVPITSFALYILIWEKLPDWGTWFNRFLAVLPSPLQRLYGQWVCAYCVGFWLALTLHASTGIWTVPAFADMPRFWGVFGPILGWFLDALVAATIIYFLKNILDAIRLPAMKANMMRPEYLKFWEEKDNGIS